MRFAAKILLPGTGWIAFMLLMDPVGLMTGKKFLPRAFGVVLLNYVIHGFQP